MNLSAKPKHVAAVLGSIIAVLASLHLLVHAVWITRRHELFGMRRIFNMGAEASLPTYFSALQLLLAALLLAVISRNEYKTSNPDRWRWALLAIGLFIMSVDEVVQIHDVLVADIVRPIVRGAEGFSENTWYYALFGEMPWLVAYLPLVGLLLAIYIPFLLRLPRRYLMLFLSAGVIFVGGAMGLDMIEGYLNLEGIRGYIFQINRMVEETCEMAAIALFVYALLSYISDKGIVLTFSANTELHSQNVSK